MSEPLAPGDKLYRVYNGFRDYEIEEVTIKKITRSKVWFTTSGGLSFGCRTGVDHEAALLCARAPLVAVEQFIEQERRNLLKAKQAYDAAYKWSAEVLASGARKTTK